MGDKRTQAIVSNPKYQHLRRTRLRYGWTLAVIMLLVYYSFIGVIAFDKELFALKLGEGVMTWGIPVGFGVIVFSVLITGLYVRRANSEFDRLTREIVQEAGQ
ncbi:MULTISPECIES: DUF485 domain-containing protein [Castellaniella]|uniref:Uncharacterized membrane protein (DUF485 family) n=1 Tax=Castellaniella defragrans TaxID=75697 RepID=A0A7W9WPT1_CASDE|nr:MULTISPECIES: DUF485 domain-containing protein [Castellaniella]KAB0623826.1 DUF485 domain-containing protein [Castellaniella defragrans]MBB6084888.1 uncharacterized membrane protein (DUF485 family) [Castellaniella defragrans]